MKRITIIVLLMLVVVMLVAEQPKAKQLRNPQTRMRNNKREVVSQRFDNFKKEGRFRNRHMYMLDKLELTDKQKEKVDELIYQNRLALTDLQAEAKKINLKKQKQIAAGDFTNAKKSVSEYHTKKAEIAVKQLELREQIYKLLDKKQQENYKKLFLYPAGSNK